MVAGLRSPNSKNPAGCRPRSSTPIHASARRLFPRRLQRAGLRQSSRRGDQCRDVRAGGAGRRRVVGALGAHEKARRALDIASIDDPDCRPYSPNTSAPGSPCGCGMSRPRSASPPFSATSAIRRRRASPAAPFSRLRMPSRSSRRAEPRLDRGGADAPHLYRRHSRRHIAGGIRRAAEKRYRRCAARRAAPGSAAACVP